MGFTIVNVGIRADSLAIEEADDSATKVTGKVHRGIQRDGMTKVIRIAHGGHGWLVIAKHKNTIFE